ncbi:MAG TPA: ribosome-recycling factor, partial [Candidatus Deferrimicrobiaceae bacterium]
EDARIAVRNIRREGIERIKEAEKRKEISEDMMKRWQDKVQKETDGFIKKVDEILKSKEQEILEV